MAKKPKTPVQPNDGAEPAQDVNMSHSIDDIPSATLDDLTGDMPEVKENAIAAMEAARGDALKKAQANGFDPAVHVTDAAGNPVLTKSGTFKKKNGRKPGSGSKSYVHNPEAEKRAAADSQARAVQSEYAARTVSGLLELASVKMLGDEWKLGEVERETNVVAWRDTFDYYGGVNLTPPMALALSHATIIMTRAGQPKTRNKLSLAWAWLKVKFSRNKKVNENGARPDTGANDERKNDAGDEAGGDAQK
jgi:hypothetical protein